MALEFDIEDLLPKPPPAPPPAREGMLPETKLVLCVAFGALLYVSWADTAMQIKAATTHMIITGQPSP